MHRLILLLVCLVTPMFSAVAANVIIHLAPDGCPAYVRETGAPNRCVNSNGEKQSDAVCRAQGDTITWILAGNQPFTIAFKGASPMVSSGCTTIANGERCTLQSSLPLTEYSYSVTVDQCKLDPRIIITDN